MEYVKLNNGVEMPILGYGVYQVTPEECERCVSDAIKIGYRSIDTAQAYHNEEGVGRAVRKSGIPREEFFITTKVWITNGGYEKAKASIDESLRKLQTSYVDLLLIHQPFNDYYGTYRAMEEACRVGKARAIGVSKEIMRRYGTQLMSWGPFAEGRNGFFTNGTLRTIGEKYGKTVAQTALRFLIQRGIVVIPKSTHAERMAENFDVFDFELSAEDMHSIAVLDRKESLFLSHYDPETVEYLINYE